MFKCKYAGDKDDEYCRNCDGLNMEVDDKSIPCTECAGYEKGEKVNKCTPKSKKDENDVNNKVTEGNEKVSKVKEEKKAVENTVKEDGMIKVISMRYTSGATIKKGDNYFKFVAEEECDVSQVNNVDDVREQLWAKLNGEVDKQIEELQNMN